MTENQVKKAESREALGKKAGVVGIGVNFFLFVIKLVAGIISGSVAIIADAINNLTDAASSVFVLVGYVVASKPADKEHPYGHARMEYLCGLFISIIVTVLGIELFTSSAEALFSDSEPAVYGAVSIVIMAVAIVVKILLALFCFSVGKKIGSESLRASAIDSVGDVCATSAVILGIILTPVIGPKADGIFGAIIAVYIFVMGIKLVKEASDVLLGTAPDVSVVKKIVAKLKSYDGVLGIHDLVVHSYGVDKLYAYVHLEVDSDRDILDIHDQIDSIEVDFREQMGIQLLIHPDPIAIHDERVNTLHGKISALIEEISSEYSAPISMHDFRVVFGVTHTNIIFDLAVTHDVPLTNVEIVDMMREGIKKKIGEEYNAVITIDREYSTVRY